MIYTARQLAEATLESPHFIDTDHTIQSGSRNIIYGESNVGKTWYLLSKVLDILDNPNVTERVLVIQGEGGLINQRERWQSLIHGKHEDAYFLQDYEDRLVITNDNFDLMPAVKNGDADLNTPDIQALAKLIADYKITTLAIDPTISIYTGDENSSKDFRSFTHDVLNYLIETYKLTVIMLHHTTKAGYDMRGSSVLLGWCDTATLVKKIKGAKGTQFSATIKKARDFAIPDKGKRFKLTETPHGHYLVKVGDAPAEEDEAPTQEVQLPQKWLDGTVEFFKKMNGDSWYATRLREYLGLNGAQIGQLTTYLLNKKVIKNMPDGKYCEVN